MSRKHAIISLAFLLLCAGYLAAQEFVTEGLVAFRTFDEDDVDIDGGVAYDILGNCDAVIFTTVTPVEEGKTEEALEFDGMGGYLEIPPLGDEGFPQASVECRALVHDLSPQYQGIVSTTGWSPGVVHFKFEQSEIQVHKQDGVKLRSPAEVDTWYHIVYTADTETNELKLYVNGELVAEGTAGATLQNMSNRRIESEYNGRYLNGIIDEVRIYNRVLTPEEVLQNYEVESNDLPGNVCFKPAGKLERTITAPKRRLLEWSEVEAYEIEGDPVDVSIEIVELREASGNCETPTELTVEETLPEGWTARNVSPPGGFADGKVTWKIPAAQLLTTTELAYSASGPVTSNPMIIAGTVSEKGNALTFTATTEWGAQPPTGRFKRGDANDDGRTNIADAISILGHLFGGSGDLPAPFGVCGTDPTDDTLDCKSYPPCAGR